MNMTTQSINLNKDLTNAGQFLTAPISLLFGRKVELIEKSSSLLTKIGLIALSSLLLIATLGLSHMYGLTCKRKVSTAKLTTPDESVKVKRDSSPVPLHIEDPRPTLIEPDDFIAALKSEYSETTREAYLSKIQEFIDNPEAVYRIGAMQNLFIESLESKQVHICLLILSLFEPKLSKDFLCDEILKKFKSVLLEEKSVVNPEASNLFGFANALKVVLPKIKFSDEQLKRIFVRACCCNTNINLLNQMVIDKGDEFFKDVYHEAFVTTLDIAPVVVGSVQMMLMRSIALTDGGHVIGALYGDPEKGKDKKVAEKLFNHGTLSTGSSKIIKHQTATAARL